MLEFIHPFRSGTLQDQLRIRHNPDHRALWKILNLLQ